MLIKKGKCPLIKLLEAQRYLTLEKVLFALDIEDGWPPVGAEGVWVENVEGNYQLKNIPFFIPNLALDDVFQAELDPVNEHIFEYEIIKRSGNSVAWLMNNQRIDIGDFIQKIKSLGCEYESFPKFSLGSINVPESVDIDQLDKVIDEYEALGLDFAFPVWHFE